MAKIKINDLAKDLNMSAKELVAFIEKTTGAEKKTAGSVDENEFSIIMDKLTAKNSVKNFDEYFATGAEAHEKKAAERQAEKDKKFADQMAILEQLKAAQAAQSGAKEEKSTPKKEEKPTPKKVAKPEPKTKQEKAPVKKEEKKEFKPSDPNPFKKREKKENAGAAPNRGPAEIRRVDTRTNTIDMEKYNEKYENIAPANSMKDNFSKKQKIRQKSQDYRRPQGAKRETEADKLRRIALQNQKKHQLKVLIPEEIVVSELAMRLKVTAAEVIKRASQAA